MSKILLRFTERYKNKHGSRVIIKKVFTYSREKFGNLTPFWEREDCEILTDNKHLVSGTLSAEEEISSK